MAALIDGMNQDLGKDVRDISVYSLNSALDTAVRASSAQYDDPDIIARLQIRLEESIGTETGKLQGGLLQEPHTHYGNMASKIVRGSQWWKLPLSFAPKEKNKNQDAQ